jgi:hypothetical protein
MIYYFYFYCRHERVIKYKVKEEYRFLIKEDLVCVVEK